MGIANIINTSTSGGGGGEIIRELVNSSDGQGLYFSNTGYIHLANNAAVEFGTSDFSIEFVMNQTGEVGSSGGSIYQSATTTNNKFSIENHVSSNVVRLIFFNAVGSATQYDLSYNMAADYNEPTHYVVSCDRSGNAVLYRNGTEVASVSIATSASINLGDGVSSTAMIGNSGSGYTFLGGLYRFRTWNKSLTHDEVGTCFQRADVPFIDQYGNETDLVNANSSGSGTAWTGASGTTAPTGWSPAGSSRTYTIDAGTGDPAPSLKIDAGSANVGIKWGGTATLGKKHRVTFSYKCGDAATTMAYRLNDADSFVNLANSTTWATKTVEWTGDGVTGGFMLRVNESGKFGHVDTVSIRAIGVLTDHDLAFANPTQSAMCQDRAGNSDGTMGGTIQQTQPIVQLNSTSARIGTSAESPADNQLIAGKLTASNSTGVTESQAISGGVTNRITANATGGDAAIGTSSAHPLLLQTGGTTRVTISSTGLVGVNQGAPVQQMQVTGDGSGSTSVDSHGYGLRVSDSNHAHGAVDIVSSADTAQFIARSNVQGGFSFKSYASVGTSLVERLKIDASGNVGINVASPGYKLDVEESTGNEIARFQGANSGSLVMRNDAANEFKMYAGASDSLGLSGGNVSASSHLTISSTGVVSTTGNVAINHASPNTQLDIKSTPLTVGASGLTKDNCRQLGLLITPGGTGSNTNGDIYSGFALGDGYAGMYGYDDGSGSATGLGLFTGNSTTVVERLKIDSAGTASFTGELSCTGLTISNQTNTTVGTRTSSKFDHYEEGTFTASLTAATPPTSVPTATGNYIRVGKLCYIQIRFNNVDTSGASGAMEVTGLPFTSANTNDSNVANQLLGQFYNLPWLPSNPKITRNDNKVTFVSQNNGAAWSSYNISANSGVYLHIAGTYVV